MYLKYKNSNWISLIDICLFFMDKVYNWTGLSTFFIKPVFYELSNLDKFFYSPYFLRLIGDAAKNQLTTNPENTVFDAKRLIGRDWSDKTVASDMKYFPFKLVEKNAKPHIQVIDWVNLQLAHLILGDFFFFFWEFAFKFKWGKILTYNNFI